jgi:RHS repeat-associated protein
VIALSDAVGNPVQRRAYGVYGGKADQGEVRGTSTPPNEAAQMEPATNGAAHPFGYTGRRWDPDLELYYYRARWYDPQLGTFLQTDPIGSLDYINWTCNASVPVRCLFVRRLSLRKPVG